MFSNASFNLYAGLTKAKCNIISIMGNGTISNKETRYIGVNKINTRMFILKTPDIVEHPSFSSMVALAIGAKEFCM